LSDHDITPSEGPEKVKLWDPFLRLFHWTLVITVATSWVMGEFGPAIMTIHFWSGYFICGLLLFRVAWGIFGPKPARFAEFVPKPRTALKYAKSMTKRAPSHWPGHNPLGALSVIALLSLLLAQVTTGLFADPEDYVNVGPLAHLVDASVNRQASVWHERIAYALLVLVALHVAVILFYRVWKREDLIGPMIHGWKWVRRR
jgi:cytochrome b